MILPTRCVIWLRRSRGAVLVRENLLIRWDRRFAKNLDQDWTRHVTCHLSSSSLTAFGLPIPAPAVTRKSGASASARGARAPNSETQASPGGPFTLAHPAAALAGLAEGPAPLPTPNGHRLASAGLSLVLALEFPCPRRPTHRGLPIHQPHSTNVVQQSHLGEQTHPSRTG